MKTKYKITIAKLIFKLLNLFGFSRTQIVNRDGINWKLDISEGIDLSIYLFGNFEKEIIKAINNLSDKKDFDILDIGSNIGANTLHFAKEYNNSKIFCIEPTQYAFSKLKENILLNPNLKKNIFFFQSFISNNQLPNKLFSSWSLEGNDKNYHMHHKGILKQTSGSNIISLDKFLENFVDNKNLVIKCDVDGNELEVFKSGKNFLNNYKPNIIMEFAPYLYKEKGYTKEELISFFTKLDYKFYDTKSFKEIINISQYVSQIDIGSSKNVFLR